MKAQTKALVASVVVIALALSAVSGITYSWFSDTEQSKIDVTTAKVDLEPSYTTSSTSSIDTTLTKGDLTDGAQPFTLNGLAASYQGTIISNIENNSTVKTVYRMYATWEKESGASITNYDIQNISINGNYLSATVGTTDSPLTITDWTLLEVSQKPTPTRIVITTPTTYGDAGTASGSYKLPDGTNYAAGDWDAQTAHSGLTINVVIEAYQGDYPYQTMEVSDNTATVSALPANKVVEATESLTVDDKSVSNVVVDFSNVSTYDEGEEKNKSVAGQKLTVTINSITAEGSAKNVSLTLTLGGETTAKTKEFDKPVIITMTVPLALSDPKIVYNGAEDGTVLSSTVNGDTTTIVFSVDHFSTYDIVDTSIVMTADTLQTSLTAGGYVKLGADISLESTINVSSKAILDLNGHDITMTRTAVAITVSGNANLTIKGQGQVDGGSGGNNKTVKVEENGVLTIESGDYTVGSDADGNGNSVIECWGGTIIIKGGYFHTDYNYNGFYYVLNQKNQSPGTITVYGGVFENYDPSKGDDNLKGDFVADGYESFDFDNRSKWIVLPEDAVALYESNGEVLGYYTDLSKAFSDPTDYIPINY